MLDLVKVFPINLKDRKQHNNEHPELFLSKLTGCYSIRKSWVFLNMVLFMLSRIFKTTPTSFTRTT